MTDIVLDAKEFWKALSMRATAAAIVTAKGTGGPAGFVALSATHFSATPPLMTIAVSASTSALSSIEESGVFAINYLSAEAMTVWDRFSAWDAPKGAERFDGIEWHYGEAGAPVFSAVTGALECRLQETLERHGTYLLFGEVIGVTQNAGVPPLVHFAGKAQPLETESM